MSTCGIHGTPTPIDAEPRRCSSCDGLMPYWHELIERPPLSGGQTADLRVDTGDFRLWTSRMGIEDGEPFERTVHVEMYDDDWAEPLGDVRAGWRDLGHYDGGDPPRGLPGVTPHAFRGELAVTPRERAWVATGIPGLDGELLVRLEGDHAGDLTLNVAYRERSWHSWGPPIDAERRH